MLMIVMIMIVAMVMIVVVRVVVVMMVVRLAQVRLERRLDLRHLDPEAREGRLELRHVDDAHEPLADLGRDMPVAQDVADDRRLARRRALYMKELFGLRASSPAWRRSASCAPQRAPGTRDACGEAAYPLGEPFLRGGEAPTHVAL